MSKQPPQIITSLPPQPHFFIAPSPVTAPGYALQLPPHVSTPHSSSLTSISPWPASLAPLRPQAPFNCPAEVYFAAQPCILPAISTKSDKTLTPTTTLLREDSHSPSVSNSIKAEEPLTNCKITTGGEEKRVSYPINALIDVPGSLNRGSRTSSLNSSLSSIRFGGSLSQLWATSLSSLSTKVNGMKSTGNLHAEASMPSLGNQYVALGGSLPELSLTSLTRLLPNSSATTGSTSSDGGTSSGGGGGLYTLIQSPLCVYPSQSHLATPFINANGSITFGSFLSSGSSLCSAQQTSESPPPTSKQSNEARNNSGSPEIDVSPGCYSSTTTSASNGAIAPGSLSTLAYVASAQKTLDTNCSEGFPLMTVSNHLPGQSPLSSSTHGLSPIQPPTSCLSPEDHSLEIDCRVPSSPATGYSVVTSVGIGAHLPTVKEEKDQQDYHHSYIEVKPHLVEGKKDSFKDKPYKCDYPGCGRSFSFPAHLRSHVQQIHISYRPCKCDFPGCGKRFYTPQHLNVHRRIHTGERPFVCPYSDCSKAFTTAGNLKNHIRTHTGERPYACKFDGCSKRFAEMSSLKKHELTHTGEKPYKCRVCGKAFSQAGSRNTHERKHSRTGEEGEGKLTRRYRIKRVSQDDDM